MPALLTAHKCPVCDATHDFCLADGTDISFSHAYAFTCPTTGKPGTLRDVLPATTTVDACPTESVLLTDTD